MIIVNFIVQWHNGIYFLLWMTQSRDSWQFSKPFLCFCIFLANNNLYVHFISYTHICWCNHMILKCENKLNSIEDKGSANTSTIPISSISLSRGLCTLVMKCRGGSNTSNGSWFYIRANEGNKLRMRPVEECIIRTNDMMSPLQWLKVCVM